MTNIHNQQIFNMAKPNGIFSPGVILIHNNNNNSNNNNLIYKALYGCNFNLDNVDLIPCELRNTFSTPSKFLP